MSEESGNGRVTWRKLEDGCPYGMRISDRVERVQNDLLGVKGDMGDVKKKLDRTFWALVLAALSLGSAALMLGLNLAV